MDAYLEILTRIENKVDALAAHAGASVPDAPPPPGFIAVRPSGPLGAGKVRYWPTPRPEDGEMLLGYASRCMTTISPPTGLPCYPAGYWAPIMQSAPAGANFAEQLDKISHRPEWMTQAELDTLAAKQKQDAESGERFDR